MPLWCSLCGQSKFQFAPGFEPTVPRGSTPAKALPTHLWCSRKVLPSSPLRACESTIYSEICSPFPPPVGPRSDPQFPPHGTHGGGGPAGHPPCRVHMTAHQSLPPSSSPKHSTSARIPVLQGQPSARPPGQRTLYKPRPPQTRQTHLQNVSQHAYTAAQR